MTEPFLKQIARDIIQKYPQEMHKICIVLPNRRAGLFLKRYIAGEIKKTFFPPEIMAIEDFIFELSGVQKADHITLLFELYGIHLEIEGHEAQGFDQFSGLASILLSDFNEIDLSLADAKDIYRYLTEIKAISLWNPNGEPLTPFQKNYLAFYRSLYSYYEKLNEVLRNKNIAYQGMAYREALKNISGKQRDYRWEKILFCGFNALSDAEEAIIRQLLEEGNAEISWDADKFYLDIRNHEAGRFLKKYFSTWSDRWQHYISEDITSPGKEYHFTGIPRNVAQAKYAGQLIKSFSRDGDIPDSTAVVLADESLLIPVLNSIPAEVKNMNITMGYPLKLTPLARLMKDILNLQKGMEERSNSSIYVADLMRVLQHAYIRQVFRGDAEGEPASFHGFLSRITDTNTVFFPSSTIIEIFNDASPSLREILILIVSEWASVEQGLINLTKLIDLLRSSLSIDSKTGKLENEYLFQFSRIIKRFIEYTAAYDYIDNFKTLSKLFSDITDTQQMPFYGEPLQGLQIMGMLETRALDFDNIILLSANENVLPAGNRFNSFIPFDVKREKGIRTHHDKDAVYAYHFYRLLQRAKNIHILYNTESDNFGSGEKSRFISQLQYELPAANPEVMIYDEVLQIPPDLGSKEPEIIIEKSDEMMRVLAERAGKGFSASSLGSFIHCPLQFYFRYVAGIEEQEGIEETIESRTIGDVVHDALNRFYSRFEGIQPEITDLEISTEDAETIMREAFEEHYAGGQLDKGLNLLIFRLSVIYFMNFLKYERDQLKSDPGYRFTIIGLEKYYEKEFRLAKKHGDIPFKIKGFVDRLDKTTGDSIRVIDYKTGFVEDRKLRKVDMKDIFGDPEYKQAFQLMVYSLLVHDEFDEKGTGIQPGIFALQKLSKGFLTLRFENGQSPTGMLDAFRDMLMELVAAIFDTSEPFRQTEDIERCKYCEFKEICNR